MRTSGILSAIVALLISAGPTQGDVKRTSEMLNDLLSPEKYDRRVRPNAGDAPVNVQVSMTVKDVYKFCPLTQSLTVSLDLETQWLDEQLAFNASGVGRSILLVHHLDKVWQPGLFFSNSAQEWRPEVPRAPISGKLYYTGLVVLQQSLKVEFLCKMDVRRFPVDEHVCPIILASYGYSEEDVTLSWIKTPHPIRWQQKSLPNFLFQGIVYENYSTSKTTTGQYSVVKALVTLRRSIRPYLPQLLAQPLVFVMASWITFWMSGRFSWLRVLLLMFLVLGHQAAVARDISVGMGHTIRAFDVWMFGCGVFLWAALLEFGLKHIGGKAQVTEYTTLEIDKAKEEAQEEDPQNLLKILRRLFYDKANKFDSVSRVIFPASFLIFIIGFFAAYYS